MSWTTLQIRRGGCGKDVVASVAEDDVGGDAVAFLCVVGGGVNIVTFIGEGYVGGVGGEIVFVYVGGGSNVVDIFDSHP